MSIAARPPVSSWWQLAKTRECQSGRICRGFQGQGRLMMNGASPKTTEDSFWEYSRLSIPEISGRDARSRTGDIFVGHDANEGRTSPHYGLDESSHIHDQRGDPSDKVERIMNADTSVWSWERRGVCRPCIHLIFDV